MDTPKMTDAQYKAAVVRLAKPTSRWVLTADPVRSGLGWNFGAGVLLACFLGTLFVTDGTPVSSGLFLMLGGLVVLYTALLGPMTVQGIKREAAALNVLQDDVDAFEAYQSRRAQRRTTSDDWEPYKSRRQMQHEWYGDGNSDLNWRDREMGEALGIPNGDIYKANMG